MAMEKATAISAMAIIAEKGSKWVTLNDKHSNGFYLWMSDFFSILLLRVACHFRHWVSGFRLPIADLMITLPTASAYRYCH